MLLSPRKYENIHFRISYLNRPACADKSEDFRFTVTKVSSEIQILEMIPRRAIGGEAILLV